MQTKLRPGPLAQAVIALRSKCVWRGAEFPRSVSEPGSPCATTLLRRQFGPGDLPTSSPQGEVGMSEHAGAATELWGGGCRSTPSSTAGSSQARVFGVLKPKDPGASTKPYT